MIVSNALPEMIVFFFNFTEIGSTRVRAGRLLESYGGEQIGMPIEREEALGIKLKSIGLPMVVKCSLDPNQVETFIENPWGKTMFSSFHVLINPNTYRIDPDGYQVTAVKSRKYY